MGQKVIAWILHAGGVLRRTSGRVALAGALGAVVLTVALAASLTGAYSMPLSPREQPAVSGDAPDAGGNRPPRTRPRRKPAEIAGDLQARLSRHRDARQRRDEAGARRERAELRQAAREAIEDVDEQPDADAALAYWSAAIIRDAGDDPDDPAWERAQRYLKPLVAAPAGGQ